MIRRWQLVALIALMFSSVVFAAEMVVKEPLAEVFGDVDAIKHKEVDANGKDCALLKINTGLLPFDKIESNMVPVKTINHISEVWVYLSPGDRRLYLSKTGYARLIYDIPVRLESNRVYSMKVIGSGINLSKALPVTIKVTPSDAIVVIDDTLFCDISKPVLLEPNSYKLNLRKDGYSAQTITLQVNAEKVYFEYSLAPVEQVKVTIKSTPKEASFYIENILCGKTNKEIYKYPGVYNLRLVMDGYDAVEQKITVKETGDNTYEFNLIKSSVTLTVNLIPTDASLSVDNQIFSERILELAPGLHQLEASKPGYDKISKQITLIKGKSSVENMTLIQQKGKLICTVEPMEAQNTLSDGKTWQGSNSVILPVGSYTLNTKLNGYTDKKTDFTITKDKDISLDIVLTKAPIEIKQVNNTVNSISVEMVYVEGGSFTMGDTAGGGNSDEELMHQVTLSSFYIGKYEVTQKQWQEVMGSNPSIWKGDNLPVESVSWYDCIEFCNKLSQKEGLTPVYSIDKSRKDTNNQNSSDNLKWIVSVNWSANGYRLPTEAEWEYAAKGGNKSKGYKYSGSNNIGDVAWYDDNSDSKTHPVGQKQPNELGIYDMSGNVWEWCWDWYDSGYYTKSPAANPQGAGAGSYRVLRGGSWYYYGLCCRTALRYYYGPGLRYGNVGFRLIRATQ